MTAGRSDEGADMVKAPGSGVCFAGESRGGVGV